MNTPTNDRWAKLALLVEREDGTRMVYYLDEATLTEEPEYGLSWRTTYTTAPTGRIHVSIKGIASGAQVWTAPMPGDEPQEIPPARPGAGLMSIIVPCGGTEPHGKHIWARAIRDTDTWLANLECEGVEEGEQNAQQDQT